MEFIPPPQTTPLKPYGAFPPRLIVWETGSLFSYSHDRAVWLQPDIPHIVVPDMLVARWINNQCEITALNDGIRINGEPLQGTRTLQNYDLIHDDKTLRVIFDADPAGNLRQGVDERAVEDKAYWLALSPYMPVKITRQIEQHIRILLNGISVDGGENFFQWEQLACIAFDEGWFRISRGHIGLYISNGAGGMELTAELKGLSRREIRSISNWLVESVPLHLPFRYDLLFSTYDFGCYSFISSERPPIPDLDFAPSDGEDKRETLMGLSVVMLMGTCMALIQLHSESQGKVTNFQNLFTAICGAIIFPLAIILYAFIWVGLVIIARRIKLIFSYLLAGLKTAS